MRRINILMTIIVSLIFAISNVYADDISIKTVKVFDSSVSSAKVSASSLTVIPEVTFKDVNDYIILKLDFKGSNLSKYTINGISDNNSNTYVKTAYSYKDTLKDSVFMTIVYTKKTNSKVTLNDIKINMNLKYEGVSEPTVSTTTKPMVKSTTRSSTDIPDNPQTGVLSHFLTPIILIVISLFLIKYYMGHKNDATLMILIVCLSLIPLSVMAAESKKLTITIKGSKIVLSGESAPSSSEPSSKPSSESSSKPSSEPQSKYYLIINANGGTLSGSERIEYDDKVLKSVLDNKVSKSGCTVDYWLDNNLNKSIRQYADYEQSGHTLIAQWNCSSTSGTGKKILLMAGHSYYPYCAEDSERDCRGRTPTTCIVSSGYCEPNETRTLAKEVRTQLIAIGYPSNAVDIANELLGENFNDYTTTRELYVEILRRDRGKVNTISNIHFDDYAFAIEFHFNAAGSGELQTAKGVSAVCPRISSGSTTPNCGNNGAITSSIKDAVNSVLGTGVRNNSAMNVKDYLHMNSINLPFVYLETEFYDNKTVMDSYNAKRSQVARAIAETIKRYYPYS